jgi:hypothetical protein
MTDMRRVSMMGRWLLAQGEGWELIHVFKSNTKKKEKGNK